MEVRSLAVRRLALVLIAASFVTTSLAAQAQTTRARIALFEPSGQSADATLTAALCTVADSVELSLACLQRYEVQRLPAVDPTKDMAKVRSYCQANRIDQAIVGSGSARSAGGYAFRLVVYDRKSDSITLVREGASTGALDMFDATDALVAALLDGLSGTHVLFGSLTVETDPPGAAVSVNGTEVGPSPLSLRGLPVGAVTVSARSSGRETTESSVTVLDGETVSASLRLARSMGALALAVPDDAVVSIKGTDLEGKTIQGSGPEQLPTGRYEVQASCPGLSPVSQTIEIQRNATFRWVPWPKGYLVVQSDPPAEQVVVDGVELGAAPLVVRVNPGALHRVELRKAKYELYRADLSAAAARKVSFEPVLVGKPGSIRVETTPAGANVHLDNDKMLTTPCTFEGVMAGDHTISFSDLLVGRRYYAGGDATISVSPDEQSTVTQQLVPGTATLTISDMPPSASVTVEGAALDKAVLTSGAEVPAGDLDVVVSDPAGQAWRFSYTAHPGTKSSSTPGSMTTFLARRTIKVDGKIDDWEGIWPAWQMPSTTVFYRNQPGTQMTKTFVCRDDQNIYCRMEFTNGKPTTSLSKDIDAKLVYTMRLFMPHNDILIAELRFERFGGVFSWIGVWNQYSGQSTTLGQNFSWAAGDSTLEFAIPVAFIQHYLVNGPYDVDFAVANADSNGAWKSYLGSGARMLVDFVK